MTFLNPLCLSIDRLSPFLFVGGKLRRRFPLDSNLGQVLLQEIVHVEPGPPWSQLLCWKNSQSKRQGSGAPRQRAVGVTEESQPHFGEPFGGWREVGSEIEVIVTDDGGPAYTKRVTQEGSMSRVDLFGERGSEH